MYEKKPMAPRNGAALSTVIVARISGCANQKEVSLTDQDEHGRQVARELYDGPTEFHLIATKGKGERLDRPELAEVEALLRSRTVDLLICEDLGRLVRGTEAAWLLGIAVDHGVRVVAPNDFIDTNDPTWEEDVISACRDHVGHNSHTSKRLKFKLMNRFEKFGGAMARPIYGYIVSADAKTYDDWTVDPAAIPIYHEIFRRLREIPNCTVIADWLMSKGVKTGRYCRSDKWTGKMVRRLIQNPLLKGLPERGRKHTIKIHELGRRVSVPAKTEPKVRPCPHLVIIPPDAFDEVNAIVDAANKGFGRKPINGLDPLYHVPRKRTRFPGQLAQCRYCGHKYVWGGNGITANLMCNGARSWKCWNAIGFNGALAAQRIVEALHAVLSGLDGFDEQFRDLVAEDDRGSERDSGQASHRARRAQELARQKANLVAAIKDHGYSVTLKEALDDVEEEEKTLQREGRLLEARRANPLVLPRSVAELRSQFMNAFTDLAITSYEFADLLRPIVVEFHVGLVRLIDGGHLYPRGRATLDLSGIAPDLRSHAAGNGLLRKEVTFDLFEAPQREMIREKAVRLRAEGHYQDAIAVALLPLQVTQTAVSNALRLDQMMKGAGLTSPFVPVTAPPSDYNRLRRQHHPRYKYEPLPGYPLPPLK